MLLLGCPPPLSVLGKHIVFAFSSKTMGEYNKINAKKLAHILYVCVGGRVRV